MIDQQSTDSSQAKDGSLVEGGHARNSVVSVPELMMQMVTGYWVTQIVHGAARAGYADLLNGGPMTADELADAASINRGAARRHLRACAALGLVIFDGQSFAATPLIDVLRQDHPASMRGLALSQPAPGHWLSWGRFWDVLTTGDRQTVPALGDEIFDYFARTPAEAEAFTQSMTSVTASVVSGVARSLTLSDTKTAVDVGGAGGALLASLLLINPALKGLVFDLPSVISNADEDLLPVSVRSRIELISGDFFKAVPSADLYLLKWILHDWDDDQCVEILRNCRRSVTPNGRVAIIELLLGEMGEGGFAPLLDVNMMVMLPGRERSLAEYSELLGRSGFGSIRVLGTGTAMSIIEASPI